MKSIFSPRELSEAIGVSESSVKRWVDQGRIRAEKTPGGHRRIALEEAIRLVRQGDLPLTDPRALGFHDIVATRVSGRVREDSSEALYDALQAGMVDEAVGLVTAMYLEGMSVEAICDGPIRSSLFRLGSPNGDVSHVQKRAIDACLQAMGQLRMLLPPAEATAPLALGGASPGDGNILSSMMAAATLAGVGWRTTNLGADTPCIALNAGVEDDQPDLIWIAVSTPPGNETHLADLRRTITLTMSRQIRTVVIGSASVVEAIDCGQVDRIDSLASLATYASNLRTSVGAA